MKRIIYLVLSIMLVSVVCSACSKKTVTIGELSDDFTTIEITDGTTETMVALDAKQSEELYKKIKDIEFTREKSSKDNNDMSYSLRFLNDDRVMEIIIVASEDTIVYNGNFYKSETSGFDMEYLKSFFETTFQAEVIENGDSLLISPDKDSSEYKSSDKIVVSTKGSKILDKDDKEIEIEGIKVGDIVEISYNGIILESYPAQISSSTIHIIKQNILIDAYMTVINDIYTEDNGLNGGISVIAIDTSEITNLTAKEKEILLLKMKEEFKIEIMEATFDELVEEGLIDEENLYFPKGILLQIKTPNYDEETKTLTCEMEKWRSGLGAIGYDGTIQFDGTEWKITKDKMWIS